MLKFALVGCGKMAHWHAQQLETIHEVKVVALVDPISEHSHQFKEKYFHHAAEYASFESLLADSHAKLDAVVLSTPHSAHYPQAKAALERGLHVLVEKPMVTSSRHANELWKLVDKSKKLLGITFQAPYTPEFGYLAAERDKGHLGKVQIISGWLSQMWMHNTAKTWRQDPKISGGGQMYDSGAHLLNAIMWLMNDPVIQVGCFINKCDSPVDINGVVIARFQNGAIASIAIGGNCPLFRSEIQIQTDEMFIITDQYGGKLEMIGKENKPIPIHLHKDASPPGSSPHANFVQAILGKQPLRAPVRYGVLLSVLMDAIYESASTGRLIDVKPVPREI